MGQDYNALMNRHDLLTLDEGPCMKIAVIISRVLMGLPLLFFWRFTGLDGHRYCAEAYALEIRRTRRLWTLSCHRDSGWRVRWSMRRDILFKVSPYQFSPT